MLLLFDVNQYPSLFVTVYMVYCVYGLLCLQALAVKNLRGLLATTQRELPRYKRLELFAVLMGLPHEHSEGAENAEYDGGLVAIFVTLCTWLFIDVVASFPIDWCAVAARTGDLAK